MKYLNISCLWLKNIFVFGRPAFSQLDYADYIIEGKSYFVFTWRLKNACCIKIKLADFKSQLKSGSAYTSIIGEDHALKIIISNAWRSRSYTIRLKRVCIDSPIEFPIAMQSKFEVKLNLPALEQKLINLKVDTFKVQIVEKGTIKSISNISYPN